VRPAGRRRRRDGDGAALRNPGGVVALHPARRGDDEVSGVVHPNGRLASEVRHRKGRTARRPCRDKQARVHGPPRFAVRPRDDEVPVGVHRHVDVPDETGVVLSDEELAAESRPGGIEALAVDGVAGRPVALPDNDVVAGGVHRNGGVLLKAVGVIVHDDAEVLLHAIGVVALGGDAPGVEYVPTGPRHDECALRGHRDVGFSDRTTYAQPHHEPSAERRPGGGVAAAGDLPGRVAERVGVPHGHEVAVLVHGDGGFALDRDVPAAYVHFPPRRAVIQQRARLEALGVAGWTGHAVARSGAGTESLEHRHNLRRRRPALTGNPDVDGGAQSPYRGCHTCTPMDLIKSERRGGGRMSQEICNRGGAAKSGGAQGGGRRGGRRGPGARREEACWRRAGGGSLPRVENPCREWRLP